MNGEMGSAVTMPLLPFWLRVVWVIALAAVALVHLWHVWSMSGQPRWWHGGHALMAVAMMGMYLGDRLTYSSLYLAGAVLFGVVAVLTAAAAVVLRTREGVLNPLWVASAVEMAAMAYMLLPTTVRLSGLTLVLVVYLAGQTLAWILGLWGQVRVLQPVSAVPPPALAPSLAPAGAGSAPPTVAASTTSPPRVVGLPVDCAPAIRISLAVMVAAMAYMLAIM